MTHTQGKLALPLSMEDAGYIYGCTFIRDASGEVIADCSGLSHKEHASAIILACNCHSEAREALRALIEECGARPPGYAPVVKARAILERMNGGGE